MSVLEVKDLSIRFGGLQALQDVSLEVNEYEIVGLIGPNGAGKTTAFNCITGFYQPDTGVVTYRGQDVTQAPPHLKAAMGFGRTFQNVGMVKSATALENLRTAQHAKAGYDAGSGLLGTGKVLNAERRLTEKAEAILELLGLQDIRDKKVGGQSYGTLKLLELGCALATDPDILLLDEPTSGMGPDESDELGDRLLTLRREFALTMLVIEHHVPLVLRVCDHVYVLNFGRLLAEGRPSVIQSHPEVVAAYLGGEAPDALAATEETAEDAELEHQLEEAVAEHGGPAHDEAPTEVIPTQPRGERAPRDRPADEVGSARPPRAPRAGSSTPRKATTRSTTTTRGTTGTARPKRAARRAPDEDGGR
ncbi:MAG TPA: ATP-binding cassette domain-containing protein [Egibacteraceae bacterium]|nr:ATP-binding cassette domain-containing protein [Egibacteraceae bacterium]